MNIYLAGPMTGVPDHNYPAFNKAAYELRGCGHFVCNPAELSPPTGDYRRALLMDLQWIANYAEIIVLLPGWEKSQGVRVELALADCIDVPPIALADFLGARWETMGSPTHEALRERKKATNKRMANLLERLAGL